MFHFVKKPIETVDISNLLWYYNRNILKTVGFILLYGYCKIPTEDEFR